VSALVWLQRHAPHAGAPPTDSAPSRWLVSAGVDRTLRVWDAGDDALRSSPVVCKAASMAVAHTRPVLSLAAAGCLLVSGAADCTLKAWALTASLQCIRQMHSAGAISTVSTQPELAGGYLLASAGSSTGAIALWDLRQASCATLLADNASGVAAIALSGDLLFSAGGTGAVGNRVRVWDVRMGRVAAHLRGHVGRVFSIAAVDGSTVASGDGAGKVRLWQLRDGAADGAAMHSGDL